MLLAACQSAPEEAAPRVISADAQKVIDHYLEGVKGRFGALAISRDGARAAYYICQSRLAKNCDNYELNNRIVSVPSARVAAPMALSRCGGGCEVLYLNGTRQR